MTHMNKDGVPQFPTLAEVDKASREQLARWDWFLVSTSTDPAQATAERTILSRIAQRFESLGGMPPELSKKVGF
jgi:hypothetical protein